MWLKVCVYLLLVVGLERCCHRQTGGFALSKISSSYPFHPEWDVPPAEGKESLREIFSQPFRFFAQGNSCYVFLSQDGNYVLKFFKHHHLNPFAFLEGMPLPSCLRRLEQKKEGKKDRVFLSCQTAYMNLKKETGLIYVHLNTRRDTMNEQGLIIDKLGIVHRLQLDHYAFVLQKKAVPAPVYLKEQIASGCFARAKEAVLGLKRLVITCQERGYEDLDPNFLTNFGFVDGSPVKLDIGAFTKRGQEKQALRAQRKLKLASDRLVSWLAEICPQRAEELVRE